MHNDEIDAACFRFLQDLPVVEAQAYFWGYGSRTERRKAILAAMRAPKAPMFEGHPVLDGPEDKPAG
jgi:hypothetical protein